MRHPLCPTVLVTGQMRHPAIAAFFEAVLSLSSPACGKDMFRRGCQAVLSDRRSHYPASGRVHEPGERLFEADMADSLSLALTQFMSCLGSRAHLADWSMQCDLQRIATIERVLVTFMFDDACSMRMHSEISRATESVRALGRSVTRILCRYVTQDLPLHIHAMVQPATP